MSWATAACRTQRGPLGRDVYLQTSPWREPAGSLAQQDSELRWGMTVGEEPGSGWLCPPLVSACFLFGGNQMDICEHLLACHLCKLTVAPAGLGGICLLAQPTRSDLSPKPLQEFLPLPSESVLSRKRKDLRSLFLIHTASGSASYRSKSSY